MKPIRQPKVKVVKYKKNEPVELNLKIDLQPELSLVDFTKTTTKNYEIKIDKKNYEENYSNYVKSQKTYLKLDKNRPVRIGDRLNVSIKSEDEFVPESLRNQENVFLITDSDFQILPDISNELVKRRVKSGDKITIPFDLKEILKEKIKKLLNLK